MCDGKSAIYMYYLFTIIMDMTISHQLFVSVVSISVVKL